MSCSQRGFFLSVVVLTVFALGVVVRAQDKPLGEKDIVALIDQQANVTAERLHGTVRSDK